MIQRQTQIQRQKQLQHINDMWHRVLFGMELYEYATGEIKNYPANYRMEHILPELKNEKIINEAIERFKSKDIIDRDADIQLWLRAFRRGLKNQDFDGTADAPILLKDYLEWLAGRTDLQWGRVDDYIVPVLKAILGESYEQVVASMPTQLMDSQIASAHSSTKFSIQEVVHTLGIAATLVDKREARFDTGDQVEVERHSHRRGHLLHGLIRFLTGAEQDRIPHARPHEVVALLHAVLKCLVQGDDGHRKPSGIPQQITSVDRTV